MFDNAPTPPPPLAGHAVLAALGGLSAGLDEAQAAPVWSLSDGDLEQALAGCQRLVARLASVRLGLVREADGRDLASRVGSTSTGAWLRHRLNLRPGDAGWLVRLAAALDGPQALTGERLAAGELSVEHAETIVRAVHNLPKHATAEERSRAELVLLGYAETFDPAELARLGAHIKAALAEDKPGKDDDPADVRQLWLSDTAEGTVRLRGELDAETGGLLRSALDPLAKPVPGPDGAADPRTAARRRADALADLVNRAAVAGTLPATGGVRPQVTVIVDLPALLGEAGAAPAETGWGLPLSQATLQRLGCDADVTRVVFGPGGVPLDVGRAYRLVPPGLRKAVAARDRCCAFPGCDRPPGWCECHHVRHWTRDRGETCLDNLVLLCVHIITDRYIMVGGTSE